MNRAQRRKQARKRQDLPVQAIVKVPPDDISLVEALIKEQHIADDDPEYLLARYITVGILPPASLTDRAKAAAMARRDQTRMGIYRMIARQAAIARKIEEHSN